MCGIVGLIAKQGENINHSLLKVMNDTMRLRGPDEDGFFFYKNIGLAMRRLKIIDLKTGSQPIFNEEKSIVLIFNGEIYNFIELKRELEGFGHKFRTNTDTEVIVHSYEQYGFPGLISKFRGMFAFALYDMKKRRVFIARDRFGVKPLYYLSQNGRFYFASEIKAIIKDKRVVRNLDLTAVNHYLTLDYMPTPYTGFQGIRKLAPGCFIDFDLDSNDFKIKRYWTLSIQKRKETNINALIEEFDNIFKETIHIMLRSDVPLGIFLSSGLDSTLITAFISRYFNKSVDTYTAAFRESSYDESNLAKKLSDMYGTTHHKIDIVAEPEEIIDDLITAFDEPNADYGAIPLYYICKEAKKNLTVVFTGNGGDEIFAGYPILLASKIAKIYKNIPSVFIEHIIKPLIYSLPTTFKKGGFEFRAKRFLSGFSENPAVAHLLWKGIFDMERKTNLINIDIQNAVFTEDTSELFNHYFNMLNSNDTIWNLMNIDLNTFLLDDNIAVSDRISMRHSLEIRVPFLDHKLAEFAASIPSSLLIKGFTTKYFLRKAAAKYLPREIIHQKKKGFTPPLPKWLRGNLKNFMLSVLSKENIDSLHLFNYDYIRLLISEHLYGKRDNTRELWGLITFVLWHKKYIEDKI